jgi:hypothetical protein
MLENLQQKRLSRKKQEILEYTRLYQSECQESDGTPDSLLLKAETILLDSNRQFITSFVNTQPQKAELEIKIKDCTINLESEKVLKTHLIEIDTLAGNVKKYQDINSQKAKIDEWTEKLKKLDAEFQQLENQSKMMEKSFDSFFQIIWETQEN